MTTTIHFQFEKEDYDKLLDTVEGDTTKLGQLLSDALSTYLGILSQCTKGFTELQLVNPATEEYVTQIEQP